MAFPKKIDLHMHTMISDGTDTPSEILKCVEDAGIELFSITDHDSIKSSFVMRGILDDRAGEAKEAGGTGAAKGASPIYIPGIEFSCKDEEGKYHILGFGYDNNAEAINKVVDKGHTYRMTKARARVDGLKAQFGIELPEDEVDALLKLDNPGKPHIGNLLVKHGYSETMPQAIKDYLNPIRCRSEYVRPEEAIEGILQSGGIPILAHPCYGSGDQLILGEEMDQRLRRLMDYGLKGLEAYYSGFTAKLRDQMLALADKYDLYVTAGSDYHGHNKMIEIGDNGLDDANTAAPGLLRFLEDIGI